MPQYERFILYAPPPRLHESAARRAFMDTDQHDDAAPPSYLPRLPAAEWITFSALTAILALTNIYTTLLTGWGEGGSIIAVVGSVLILGSLGNHKPTIASLNMGQTMASAGASVGFATAAYAAIPLVNPGFRPDGVIMTILFMAMATLGTLVGASVRKSMIRYYFPSGTACAVIQKAVTAGEDNPESRRPARLLALWGTVAVLWTLPVKLATKAGGEALLTRIPLGIQGLAISLDPTAFGIGIIVGPRVGLSMILGALAGPFLIQPALHKANIMDPGAVQHWVQWIAISLLTLPTLAAILFALMFRLPPVETPGFSPGTVEYRAPRRRNLLFAAIGVVSVLVTAVCAHAFVGLSWPITLLVIAVSWPLCLMNGRVTGEIDINPVLLVVVVLVSVFAFLVSGEGNATLLLLGMALIGGTLAGMAVDMMQDYRTGYLVNGNPVHQTSVQLLGGILGALCSVPFMLLLDAKIGFGPGAGLTAPGQRIYAELALAIASGGAGFTRELIWTIALVSLAGCVAAFFAAWPRTAAWMPSIFGAGMGLLLPFELSAAIFVGGVLKWAVVKVYAARETGKAKEQAVLAGNNDAMLVGASIFAAAALMSVLLVLLSQAAASLGIGGIYMAQ